MDKFLIYNTEEELKERASQEAIAISSPYQYIGAIMYTTDGKFALPVTDYTTLTEEEESQVVNEIN
jgi:hypothetical protein